MIREAALIGLIVLTGCNPPRRVSDSPSDAVAAAADAQSAIVEAQAALSQADLKRAGPGGKIAAACDDQFGADTPASADCQLKIVLKAEAKRAAAQQREAERRAGQ